MENNKKQKNIRLALFVFASIALIMFDQYTKFLAKNVLRVAHPDGISVAGDFLWLYYLENTGAAFGMLKEKMWFFLLVAALMVVIVTFILYRLPSEKKFAPVAVFLTMIFAGGIGNVIDRVVNHYVVDFFYVKIINFAIFNVADIYITVGTALLIIYMLFGLKEEDLSFIRSKKDEEHE